MDVVFDALHTPLSTAEKRELIQRILLEGEANVAFTKLNGERRIMPCTLSPELIPPEILESIVPIPKRQDNLDVLRVFCLNNQSWRSFRIERVFSITDVNSSLNSTLGWK